MPLVESPSLPPAPPEWRGALTSPAFSAPARQYSKAIIRMAISGAAATSVKLYWQTEDSPGMRELRSVRFVVHPGPSDTYEVPLNQSPHWRGIITHMRLDAGRSAVIESVSLK